jgi:hypothetical protein
MSGFRNCRSGTGTEDAEWSAYFIGGNNGVGASLANCNPDERRKNRLAHGGFPNPQASDPAERSMRRPKTSNGPSADGRDAEAAAVLHQAVAHYLERLRDLSFDQFVASQEAPRLNLAHGSAGIAYALLHASRRLGNHELLALARRWIDWSLAQSDAVDAFVAGELDRDLANDSSLFWGIAGLHFVDALVADAMNDVARATKAINAIRALPAPPRAILHDLMSGGPGRLLGVSRLNAELPGAPLDATGRRQYERLCDARPSEVTKLGMAHGLGGYYFALLEWATRSGDALPHWFWADVEQLVADAEWSGLTVRWPIQRGTPAASYMHSWCNGGPGLALLWAKAYEATTDRRFLELAHGCGRHILSAPQYLSQICCGMAGQAYALLALSRLEPENPWRSVAVALAARAIRHERLKEWDESLFKGRAGLLCLAIDLLDSRPSSFLFMPGISQQAEGEQEAG